MNPKLLYIIVLAVIFSIVKIEDLHADPVIFSELKFNSPEDLCRWMKKNLRYKSESDGDNYWQSPEETFAKRTGDCEDFSLFAEHFMKGKVTDGSVVGVYGERYSHCVYIFKGAKGYEAINIATLRRYKEPSMPKLFDRILPDWQYYGFLRRGAAGEVLISRKVIR